jgi:8-oxo-dGTP pyrophosphatase MutT (NUDIX family)
MIKAAAGLILNNNRVLAFRRYNQHGLSIPCGKIEEGESSKDAAIREVYEETGLLVELEDVPPFIGFDLEEKNIVYTYLGKVKSGKMLTEESATGEGVPIWASKREIVYGPFGHYNNRLLAHFQQSVPLAGKFHSHITLEMPSSKLEAERAAKLVNGKLTVIDLSRESRNQTDFMITHHYLTGSRGLEDEYDVLALLKSRARQLEESGYKVTRVKLEHEPMHKDSDIDDILNSLNRIYTELHIKCVIDEANSDNLIELSKKANWHPSRNPFSTRDDGKLVRFVNKRLYGGRFLFEIDREVDNIIPIISDVCDIEEIKYETAIYDSNEDLDKWWMKGIEDKLVISR